MKTMFEFKPSAYAKEHFHLNEAIYNVRADSSFAALDAIFGKGALKDRHVESATNIANPDKPEGVWIPEGDLGTLRRPTLYERLWGREAAIRANKVSGPV